MKDKRIRWDILLTGLAFLMLAVLFVAECDDCYFVYWSFDSLWDFLRVRPIPEEGIVLGVPNNGRYLGNLLGLVLGKLAFSPLWPLRALILGGGLLLLTWLLARFVQRDGVNGREAFAIALFLVACAHRGVWQQVYSWAAAWANYLVPVAVILSVLLLLRENRPGRWPLLFLLALAGGLFTEQNTIWLVLTGSAIWLAGFLPGLQLPHKALRRALLLGSWAGLGVSMTNSVFNQVSSGERGLSVELVWKNLPAVFAEVMVRPVAVCLLISLLLVFLVKKEGKRWQLWGLLLLPVHGCILYRNISWDGFYSRADLILGGTLAFLWVILVCEWRGGGEKLRLWFYVASLLVVTGPMALVSPVHPRMFFSSYAFLCLIAGGLYGRARELGLRPLSALKWLAAATLVCLVFLYGQNARVYHQRLDYAQEQAARGAQELTLPLLPHVDWVSNEFVGKGDICYLVYREKPWDVRVNFVYYSKWNGFE